MDTDGSGFDVAVHEAGHAVVTYALGESLTQISTKPRTALGRELRGHVELVNGWYDPDEPLAPEGVPRARGFIMILLAGQYTERHWHRRITSREPDLRILARKAQQDEVHIMRLTNSVGRVTRADTHVIRREALRCLDKAVHATGEAYWCRVAALAKAIAGTTVTWEEAVSLLVSTEQRHGLTPMRGSWTPD